MKMSSRHRRISLSVALCLGGVGLSIISRPTSAEIVITKQVMLSKGGVAKSTNVIRTRDGRYVIMGQAGAEALELGSQLVVQKLNEDLVPIWTRKIPAGAPLPSRYLPEALAEAPDGAFFIVTNISVCTTTEDRRRCDLKARPGTKSETRFIKLDASGKVLWNRSAFTCQGVIKCDFSTFNAAAATEKGFVILSYAAWRVDGKRSPNDYGGKKWLYAVNWEGDLLWERILPNVTGVTANLTVAEDQSIVFANKELDGKAMVLRLDESGKTISQSTIEIGGGGEQRVFKIQDGYAIPLPRPSKARGRPTWDGLIELDRDLNVVRRSRYDEDFYPIFVGDVGKARSLFIVGHATSMLSNRETAAIGYLDTDRRVRERRFLDDEGHSLGIVATAGHRPGQFVLVQEILAKDPGKGFDIRMLLVDVRP